MILRVSKDVCLVCSPQLCVFRLGAFFIKILYYLCSPQVADKNLLKMKFKIGDKVSWVCKPNGYKKGFNCLGIINSFKTAAGFKDGASITVDLANSKEYVNAYPKRKKTCIGLDLLIKVP